MPSYDLTSGGGVPARVPVFISADIKVICSRITRNIGCRAGDARISIIDCGTAALYGDAVVGSAEITIGTGGIGSVDKKWVHIQVAGSCISSFNNGIGDNGLAVGISDFIVTIPKNTIG